jgi:4-carboxymuconolactone decarboxylase
MTKSAAFKAGLAARKAVLGDEYVDKAFAKADDFTLPLQEYLTEHAWGASWARGVLDFKQRSMLNLAIMTAINRPHELKIHIRGALRNGVTKEEMREIFLHCGVYCGAPAALEAFNMAKEVFAESGGKS